MNQQDLLKLYLQGIPGSVAKPAQQPNYNYWGQMGASALESLGPSLLGYQLQDLPGFDETDQAQLEAFRAQNPWSDMTAQVAGMIPYFAYAPAAGARLLGTAGKVIPAAKKAFDLTKTLDKTAIAHPILNPWASMSIKMAPMEAGRIGATALLNPEKTGDVALDAGINMAAFPLIPAAWQVLKAVSPYKGSVRRVLDALPEFPAGKQIHQQLDFLYTNEPKIPVDIQPYTAALMNQLERQVLGQTSAGQKYVKLAPGLDSEAINRLFQVKTDSTAARRMFIQSPKFGFANREEALNEFAKVKYPRNWGATTQFPRMIELAGDSQAKDIQKVISKNLMPVHNGWHLESEPDSGFYVLAKKTVGDPAKPAAGDKWVVLKTIDPNGYIGGDAIALKSDRFIKFAEKLKTAREALEFDALPGDSIASVTKRLIDTFNLKDGVQRTPGDILSKIPGGDKVKSMAEVVGKATEQERETISAVYDFIRNKVIPGQFEFRKAPGAEKVRLTAQAITDYTAAKANSIIYGKQGLKPDQSVYGRIFAQENEPGGIEAIVKQLQESDMPYVTEAVRQEWGLDTLAENLANMRVEPEALKRIMTFFQGASRIESKVMGELTGSQKLYGLPELEARPNHFLISHVWPGDWRHRVVGENGQTIAIGAGRTSGASTQEAERLSRIFGGKVHDDGPFITNREEDVKLANMVLKRQRNFLDARGRPLGSDPYTFRLRQGVKGFTGSTDDITRQELLNIMGGNVRSKLNYLAEQSFNHQVLPDAIDVWHRYGPAAFRDLTYRVNQMFGIKGPVNKAINRAFRPLEKLFGKNAADKLAKGYNQAELVATLLTFNFAHVAMNASTFVQTVLPKIAYMQALGPENFDKVLGFVPDIDKTGMPKGVTGILDPLKISLYAFRQMARPDAELRKIFDRAAGEGVITGGLQENYIGERSAMGRWVTGIAGETNPVGEMLAKLADSPFINPSKKVEEASRAHALTVGKELAERFGVVDPEAKYQFAKQFTYRTMYQYTTADRPRLFNGPLGSTFGLFKNWTMHYLNDLWGYTSAFGKGEAFSPLLWALGGNAALAGAGGLPLYGAADAFSRFASDKPLMENIYNWFGGDDKEIADVVYYGLPALFGVSLQANASAPFANPVRDIAYLTNFAWLERARRVGKLGAYLGDQIGAGQNPLETDRTWDLFSYALMPRVFYKSMAQIEDGALKAISNGQPIIDGLSYGDYLLNSFSITPTEISKAYELNQQIWTEKNAQKDQTTRFGDAYFQAWQAQDSVQMQDVIRTALLQGADLPGVMRSARARMRESLVPNLSPVGMRDPEFLMRAQAIGLGG